MSLDMIEIGTRAGLVLVAGGRGLRLGSDMPKQYLRVNGRTLLSHALEIALSQPLIGPVVLVTHPDDSARLDAALRDVPLFEARRTEVLFAHGGANRQDSVLAGLETLAKVGFGNGNLVLVHDAARPFATAALMERVILAAAESGAAIPVLKVNDTIKRLDGDGLVLESVPRDSLRAVQTPQAFRFDMLLEAHRRARAEDRVEFTDDASLFEWLGHPVRCIEGEEGAFKVTTEADLKLAEMRFGSGLLTRVATGYDVHAFGQGDHLWLGGVKIAHSAGLVGHSDADPVLHALTDALLGTIGDGDIGQHFPPSDPQWRGMASHVFLSHAAKLVRDKGGRVVHLDATIICEEPKVGPHRTAMREAIAAACGLDLASISVKATTSERLGFTGRREGIAAIGTATVLLPAAL
jgi:2-C-methyl-D-erythritol 4-phosphate cytidylyltransferase/2-C-methyl-D-erythritol 2,4-cyclodiphosphate synthase